MTSVGGNRELRKKGASAAMWRFLQATNTFVFDPDNQGYPVQLGGSGGLKVVNTLLFTASPTISSGFGTSPSVIAANGPAAFEINVGTGGSASSGVIGLPTAANSWNCFVNDTTTVSTSVFYTKMIAATLSTATIANYNTAGTQTAWGSGDILHVSCFPN